ncbi:MAG: hypothetical protein M3N23_03515 [Pseudomonadota bacterium]|nr:hypothetical protein [Pseudomonadota bacterium]
MQPDNYAVSRPNDANAIYGRIKGAAIMACFGAVWLGLGLLQAGVTTAYAVLAAAITLAVPMVAGTMLVRRARRDHPPMQTQWPANTRRTFIGINVAQWVAIFSASLLLQALGLPQWINLSIIAVVGLHFIPLARLFGYWPHYVTGMAMLIIALLVGTLAPNDPQTSLAPIASGLVLWISALAAILSARRAAQRTGMPTVNDNAMRV